MRNLLLMATLLLALTSPAFAAVEPKPGALIDQMGRPVSGSALSGQYLLVYFGYSSCPGICQATLSLMSNVLDNLGPERNNLKAFFVTVDPGRDTPPVMRQYLRHFSPEITGLTGRAEDIAAMAAEFRLGITPGPRGALSHGVLIYFMDPDGRLIKSFHPRVGTEAILKDIKTALEKQPL